MGFNSGFKGLNNFRCTFPKLSRTFHSSEYYKEARPRRTSRDWQV